MDTTLLLLALLASTAVNVVLALALALTVRGRAEPRRPVRKAAHPVELPRDAGAGADPGGAPAPPLPGSRREAILALLGRGATREQILAETGASRGEVDLVLRLERRAASP
jgi:hypothetical protein